MLTIKLGSMKWPSSRVITVNYHSTDKDLLFMLLGWNSCGSCKMLPCKKRRTSVTESAQQQDGQEGDDLDLEAAVKPDTDQLPDCGSESLSWGQSHDSAVCPDVHSMQDVDNQLSVEDPSFSSKMLTQHANLAVLEGVDVAMSQDIPLPSLESSHSLPVHTDKGRLQASASRKGKKIVFTPGQVTREDQENHPAPEEPPSGEPAGEAKAGEGKDERPGLLFLFLFMLTISDLCI